MFTENKIYYKVYNYCLNAKPGVILAGFTNIHCDLNI